MAEPRLRFTQADYDRLPEDLRVELVDGELLKMPSPTMRHQEVAKRLFAVIVEAVGLDRVFFGPLDFAVDDTNVLVPDLVVLPPRPPPAEGRLTRAVLVLEVLSPSTAARDRVTKAGLYLAAGVEEVWLVDPEARRIEIRDRRETRLVETGGRAASRALPRVVVDPARVF